MKNDLQEFFLSTRIVMGNGSVKNISSELSRFKVDKILIMTDPGIEEAGILEKVKQALESGHQSYVVFSSVEPNPRAETISKAYNVYKEEKCQGLLAVGGGSSIDAAKGVSVLATNGGKIQDYIGINVYKNPPAPLMAIPTTVGTGSEATWVSMVTLTDVKQKVAILGWDLFPRVAILDPELIQTLPPGLTAGTGMDALSHAIEGYVSIRANPIADGLHRQAMSLIGKNLRAAVSNSRNLDAMGNMLVASTIAGMGISNSGVGLVHAMSYPLTNYFDVPHSHANAILLPHVMRFNWIAGADKFADIVTLLGGSQASSLSETARTSADVVADLARDIGIPSGLGEVGVDKGAIEKMAEEVPGSANALNNPRPATFEDVVEIYKKAM